MELIVDIYLYMYIGLTESRIYNLYIYMYLFSVIFINVICYKGFYFSVEKGWGFFLNGKGLKGLRGRVFVSLFSLNIIYYNIFVGFFKVLLLFLIVVFIIIIIIICFINI